MNLAEILKKLKSARRQLDVLPEVEILEDWQYDESILKWYLKFQIHVETNHAGLLNCSHWFLTTGNQYPLGTIKIYPAVEEGIAVTFPHQANNGCLADNQLWRKGALCLDISAPFFADRNLSEPSEVDEKILWHVKRAINWIKAANDGTMQGPGTYYELPDFQNCSSQTFIFSEDYLSTMRWEDIESDYGFANVNGCMLGKPTFRVIEFFDCSMRSILRVKWGAFFGDKESFDQKAIWVMLKNAPTVKVWQAPNNYGELVEALNAQNISFANIMRRLAKHIRDGHEHFLLFGFPIPKLIGTDEQQIFWKALKLPILSFGEQKVNGFRAKREPGYWYRDRSEVLKSDLSLNWIDSQNWNNDEITNRGKMHNILLRKKIAIIGAGCLGSTLAELLVRAGVYNLTIIDQDILEIGNMSRHVLNLTDVGGSKEQSLGKHLNRINPNVNVKVETAKVRHSQDLDTLNMKSYDVIFDCTGSNDVLKLFDDAQLKAAAFFISIAIGTKARYLFLYLSRTENRSIEQFSTLLNKYISSEEIYTDDFPRDGFGCWHPKFPARSDDIWLASSTALKTIENYIVTEQTVSQSIVMEQHYVKDVFSGYCVKEKLSNVNEFD